MPYVYGGSTPAQGFDCSGLIQYVFRAAGYLMPRVSNDQGRMGARVPVSQIAAGDLISWPGHIVLYLGNGLILESQQPGTVVHIRALGHSGFDAQGVGVRLNYATLPRT